MNREITTKTKKKSRVPRDNKINPQCVLKEQKDLETITWSAKKPPWEDFRLFLDGEKINFCAQQISVQAPVGVGGPGSFFIDFYFLSKMSSRGFLLRIPDDDSFDQPDIRSLSPNILVSRSDFFEGEKWVNTRASSDVTEFSFDFRFIDEF